MTQEKRCLIGFRHDLNSNKKWNPIFSISFLSDCLREGFGELLSFFFFRACWFSLKLLNPKKTKMTGHKILSYHWDHFQSILESDRHFGERERCVRNRKSIINKIADDGKEIQKEILCVFILLSLMQLIQSEKSFLSWDSSAGIMEINTFSFLSFQRFFSKIPKEEKEKEKDNWSMWILHRN